MSVRATTVTTFATIRTMMGTMAVAKIAYAPARWLAWATTEARPRHILSNGAT